MSLAQNNEVTEAYRYIHIENSSLTTKMAYLFTYSIKILDFLFRYDLEGKMCIQALSFVHSSVEEGIDSSFSGGQGLL